jgi:hypothetical protein
MENQSNAVVSEAMVWAQQSVVVLNLKVASH